MSNQEFDYKKIIELVIRRRWLFVFTALLVMTVSVIVSYVLPRIYEAKSTVFIERNVVSELVKGIAVTPSMEQALNVLKVAMTTRPLLVKVINELDMNTGKTSDAELNSRIKSVGKNLNINVNKDNGMFVISYRNGNPRLARDLVNTLVRTYIEQNLSSKREESYGAIQFFSGQIEEVRKKIEKADEEINRFKAQQSSGVNSADETRLYSDINAAQLRLNDVQERRRHLEGLRPVAKREGDSLYNQLKALEKRQAELRTQFNDNYPELIRIRGEIDSLLHQMSSRTAHTGTDAVSQEVAKIDAEINALRSSEEGLKRTIASSQAQLRRMPSVKASLEQLEADRRQQTQLYDQLLARQGQSEVSKQVEVQDKTTTYRIVEPAVMPTSPISPNRLRIMLIGILAGISVGIGLLFGLDLLDNTIKSVDTVKTFGIQVLAVVPKIPDRDQELRTARRNRVLSICSVAYLSLILIVIAMEAAGLPYLDNMATQIHKLF